MNNQSTVNTLNNCINLLSKTIYQNPIIYWIKYLLSIALMLFLVITLFTLTILFFQIDANLITATLEINEETSIDFVVKHKRYEELAAWLRLIIAMAIVVLILFLLLLRRNHQKRTLLKTCLDQINEAKEQLGII
ncbi:MAG: hypothetical protein MUC81_05055 [Bacteroidia bacterium]|jgi:hypothetical protein|nr:hypothetical protein [Bacteroidia bacterium]